MAHTILQKAAPRSVLGIDSSEGYISYASSRIADERARFRTADAQALPAEPASFDAVVSGLVLNFIPQPLLAANEMIRVTRSGGRVAAYVWDYSGRMQF